MPQTTAEVQYRITSAERQREQHQVEVDAVRRRIAAEQSELATCEQRVLEDDRQLISLQQELARATSEESQSTTTTLPFSLF